MKNGLIIRKVRCLLIADCCVLLLCVSQENPIISGVMAALLRKGLPQFLRMALYSNSLDFSLCFI